MENYRKGYGKITKCQVFILSCEGCLGASAYPRKQLHEGYGYGWRSATGKRGVYYG